MAADFNKPVTTDAYTAVLQTLRDNIAACAVMLDPNAAASSGATNIPTGAFRINAGAIQQWNGTTWGAYSLNYLPLSGGTLMGAFKINATGGSAQYLAISGGWARGWIYRDAADANTLAGFGFFGSGDSANQFTVGAGANWWAGATNWLVMDAATARYVGSHRAGSATRPAFQSQSDIGVGDFVIMSSGGTNRWVFAKNAAESGSNAGSDLFLSAYDDTGTLIDYPFSIVRAAGGALSISRPTTLSQLLTTQSGITNESGIIRNKGNVIAVGPAGAAPGNGGNFRVYDDTATARWLFGLLGSAGAKNFSLFDLANNALRFSVDSTNGTCTCATAGQTATLVVQDTGSNGANLRLAGDGATTPNKTLRVRAGVLEVINSAYSSVVASISDAGAFTAAASVSAPLITQTSDETLKTHIRALRTDAAAIFALEHAAAYFDWKETLQPDAGFIAQRVGLAEPRAVHQRADGKLMINIVPIVAHLAAHAADVERRLQRLEGLAA